MALTNDRARDSITAAQVFLEIAKAAKDLIDDPKYLEKLARDAYGLAEAEQTRANEAREKIDEFRSLKETVEAKSKQVCKDLDKLESEKSELIAAKARADERSKSLDKREVELDKRQDDLDARETGLAQREDKIKTQETTVSQKIAYAEKAKKEADELLAEAKTRVAQIKELAGM